MIALQCYYVGGTEDSATSIIGELTKPVAWGMPADKICLKLYKKDEQICDLRYGMYFYKMYISQASSRLL